MTVSFAMRSPFTSAYNKRILPFHHSAVTYNPQYIEKMAKFQAYATKSDNVAVSTRTMNDVVDEESSTISTNERKSDTYDLGQEVFRRRLDAPDENMEQYWTIKRANPIDESETEDEETDA